MLPRLEAASRIICSTVLDSLNTAVRTRCVDKIHGQTLGGVSCQNCCVPHLPDGLKLRQYLRLRLQVGNCHEQLTNVFEVEMFLGCSDGLSCHLCLNSFGLQQRSRKFG